MRKSERNERAFLQYIHSNVINTHIKVKLRNRKSNEIQWDPKSGWVQILNVRKCSKAMVWILNTNQNID